MKLKTILTEDEYTALNEDLHENYVERKDSEDHTIYRLEVEGLEEVSGLKSALKKERDNFKASNAQVKALEEKIETLKTSGGSAEELQAAQTKLADLEKNFGGLSKTLKTVVRDKAITEAIEANNGFAELGPAYLKEKVKVEVDGDKVTVHIEHDGAKLTVNDYTAQLSAAAGDKSHPLYTEGLGRMFKASGHSGGGTPPTGGGNNKGGSRGRTIDTKPRSQMQTKDKVAFIKEHGEDAFMKLPA